MIYNIAKSMSPDFVNTALKQIAAASCSTPHLCRTSCFLYSDTFSYLALSLPPASLPSSPSFIIMTLLLCAPYCKI